MRIKRTSAPHRIERRVASNLNFRPMAVSALKGIFGLVTIAFFLIPIAWIFISSFKRRIDILQYPPTLVFTPTFSYYFRVLSTGFTNWLADSVLVVVASTILVVFIGSLAAYSLARFRIPAGKDIAFFILSLRMVPPIVSIIPLYLLMRYVGLLDTHIGLVLVYTFMNLPLVVWIMRSVFMEIPAEIDESAMIDGASVWQIFWRISLPLARSGVATVTIFSLVLAWNEFMFALMLAGSDVKTLPVGAVTFIASRGVEWGNVTAAASLILLPIFIVVLLGQRAFVKGLTLGAVK